MKIFRPRIAGTALCALAALAACGGGGGGGDGGGSSVSAPKNLVYPTTPAILLLDAVAPVNTPTFQGKVDKFSVSPALPAGMTIHTKTGVISGTPTEVEPLTKHTVEAKNKGGKVTFPLHIGVRPPQRFLYVVHRDDSTIELFTLAAATGAPERAGFVASGAGEVGPERIVIHPSNRFAYVSNTDSSNVSVYAIDPQSGWLTPGTPVGVGLGPHALVIDHGGRFLFVANRGNDQLHTFAIDELTGALAQVGAPFSPGVQPSALVIDATNSTLFMTLRGSDGTGLGSALRAYTLDPLTGALTTFGNPQPLNGGQPVAVSLDPIHPVAYVVLEAFDILLPIRYDAQSAAYTIATPAATGMLPAALGVHPTGRFAYVANADENTLSTFAVAGAQPAVLAFGEVPAGVRPIAVVLDPLGDALYAISRDSSELARFRIEAGGSLEFAASLITRAQPVDIAIAHGTEPITHVPRFVYVANGESDDITGFEIDAVNGALSSVGPDVLACDTPAALAYAPRLQRLYVGCRDGSEIRAFDVDPDDGSLTADPVATPVTGGPASMVFDASQRFLYVALGDVVTVDDGWISTYAVAEDGALTLLDSQEVGVRPSSVSCDPAGEFLYVANSGNGFQGTSTISIFRLGAQSGLPVTSSQTMLAPGVHAVDFESTGRWAYGNFSNSNVVVHYSIERSNGSLSLGSSTRAGLEPRAIEITRDGRFGYIAFFESTGNGHVAAVAFDPAGEFTPGAYIVIDGLHPADLALDPSGRFLYVANSGSNDVSVMSLDPQTGHPAVQLPGVCGLDPRALVVTGVID